MPQQSRDADNAVGSNDQNSVALSLPCSTEEQAMQLVVEKGEASNCEGQQLPPAQPLGCGLNIETDSPQAALLQR